MFLKTDSNPIPTWISYAKKRKPKAPLLCRSVQEIEAEIALLDEEDLQEFLQELGLQESGLDQVIRAGYALLELLTFFTAGKREVRAWTVKSGSTAPQAAGRIHTDFERGFIRAEVTDF